MSAYSIVAWHGFFAATLGAAAALTGLVFVAVSINIERILKYPGLSERALERLLILLGVAIVSIFALAPRQSERAVGIELPAESLVLAARVVAPLRRAGVRRCVGGP